MKPKTTHGSADFAHMIAQYQPVLCFLLDLVPEQRPSSGWPEAFTRADLLAEDLSCTPVIFTHFYQSRGSDNARKLAAQEKLAELRVLNLYDTLQEIDSAVPSTDHPQREPLPDEGWKIEDVPDTHDTKLLDGDGHCVVYRRSLPDGGGTDCMNFISTNGICRRDTFDVRGFMSRTEFINPQDNFSFAQVYYRPDHSIALTESYGKNDKGERVMFAAELMNRQGHCTHRFFSHEDLVAWWLLSLLREPDCTYLLFPDCPRGYLKALRELRSPSALHRAVKVAVPLWERACPQGGLKEMLEYGGAEPDLIACREPEALRQQSELSIPAATSLLKYPEVGAIGNEQILFWKKCLETLLQEQNSGRKPKSK